MKTIECGSYGDPDRLIVEGPSIRVDIGFDPAWRSHHEHPPAPGSQNVAALIDTGATECFIDCDLADQLGLPVINRRQVSGSLGKHEVNVYLAQIFIPSLLHVQDGDFAGVYLRRGGMIYDILMGRTFLHSFVLTYNGQNGRVALSR